MVGRNRDSNTTYHMRMIGVLVWSVERLQVATQIGERVNGNGQNSGVGSMLPMFPSSVVGSLHSL